MRIEFADTYTASIFVTGENVVEACQKYCNTRGLCVTITETLHVYTGGQEKGYIIGLINYPRFPKSTSELEEIAHDLAHYVFEQTNYEGSFTIQTSVETAFVSNRPQDN